MIDIVLNCFDFLFSVLRSSYLLSFLALLIFSSAVFLIKSIVWGKK